VDGAVISGLALSAPFGSIGDLAITKTKPAANGADGIGIRIEANGSGGPIRRFTIDGNQGVGVGIDISSAVAPPPFSLGTIRDNAIGVHAKSAAQLDKLFTDVVFEEDHDAVSYDE
jgi:hypothetical protein